MHAIGRYRLGPLHGNTPGGRLAFYPPSSSLLTMRGAASACLRGTTVALATLGGVFSAPLLENAQPNVLLEGMNRGNNPKHMRASGNGYWFEAFPHSKVPTSSLFIIIVAAGISVVFLLATMVMIALNSLRQSRTSKERADAISKLRVLGVRSEKDVPPPPQHDEENVVPLAAEPMPAPDSTGTLHTMRSGSGMPSDSEDERADSKESYMRPSGTQESLPTSGPKKVKDANEIAGPIVPVLRSEDPGLSTDEEAETEEESEEEPEEDGYGEYQYNGPTDKAPAYDMEPPTEPVSVPGAAPVAQPTVTFAQDTVATERYDLPPPIPGSATVANEIPTAQGPASTEAAVPHSAEEHNSATVPNYVP